MLAARHDIRVLRPQSLPLGERFETEEDAERYRDLAIEKLRTPCREPSRKALQRALMAATILEECRDQFYQCRKTYCPVCMRPYRVWLISRLLRIVQRVKRPVYVGTLLIEEIPFRDLWAWDMADAHDQLRQHLRSVGLDAAKIAGGTEVCRRRGRRSWVAHINLVFLGVELSMINRLASPYRDVIKETGSDMIRPLIPAQLNDPAEQLSYVQKFVTYQRPTQQIGNVRPDAFPLNPPQHNELIPWMGKYEPSDFLFLKNVPTSAFRSVRWNIG